MLCSLSQIVLLYVFIVLSHTAGDDCQTNDHVDGCSTPLDIHLFYQTNFTASCNQHDICYYCVIFCNLNYMYIQIVK